MDRCAATEEVFAVALAVSSRGSDIYVISVSPDRFAGGGRGGGCCLQRSWLPLKPSTRSRLLQPLRS